MYRICELKNNKLLTLFHGIQGSREMPLNTWLKADVKNVVDGTRKTATPYTSGFHVLKTLEETQKFLKAKFRAKRTLVIVECEIGPDCWKKTHSRNEVYLAKEIKILRIIEEIKL